jgi:hypothetical protein
VAIKMCDLLDGNLTPKKINFHNEIKEEGVRRDARGGREIERNILDLKFDMVYFRTFFYMKGN